MYSKLEAYVEKIFEGADGLYVRDAKEELLANLYDKYNDLLDEGKSEAEAYQLVISGIGEIDELFKNPLQDESKPEVKPDRVIVTKAVETLEPVKTEDQSVKAGKKERGKNEEQKRTILILLWVSIIAVFVAISFPTDLWSVMWIIIPIGGFLTVVILYNFSKSTLMEQKREKYIYGMIWSGVLAVYLSVSMIINEIRESRFRDPWRDDWTFVENRFWDVWSWSWFILILGVVATAVIKYMLNRRKNKD